VVLALLVLLVHLVVFFIFFHFSSKQFSGNELCTLEFVSGVWFEARHKRSWSSQMMAEEPFDVFVFREAHSGKQPAKAGVSEPEFWVLRLAFFGFALVESIRDGFNRKDTISYMML